MAFILNGKKRGLAYCNGKRCLVLKAVVEQDTPTMEKLSTPSISVSGVKLRISGSGQPVYPEEIVIFVNGVEMKTMEVQ